MNCGLRSVASRWARVLQANKGSKREFIPPAHHAVRWRRAKLPMLPLLQNHPLNPDNLPISPVLLGEVRAQALEEHVRSGRHQRHHRLRPQHLVQPRALCVCVCVCVRA
jgi:hypothetical protein